MVSLYALTYILASVFRYTAYRITTVFVIVGGLAIIVSLLRIPYRRTVMLAGFSLCIFTSLGLLLFQGLPFRFLLRPCLEQVALALCLFFLAQIDNLTGLTYQLGGDRHPYLMTFWGFIVLLLIFSDYLNFSRDLTMVQSYPQIFQPFMQIHGVGFIIDEFARFNVITIVYSLLSFYLFPIAQTMIVWILKKLHIPVPASLIDSFGTLAERYNDYENSGRWLTYTFKREHFINGYHQYTDFYIQNRFEKDPRKRDALYSIASRVSVKTLFAVLYFSGVFLLAIFIVNIYFLIMLSQFLKKRSRKTA